MRPFKISASRLRLTILILFSLLIIWPFVVKLYYTNFLYNDASLISLSQLGGIFGSLGTLLALVALIFSIYSNAIQGEQLTQIRREASLNQYRHYRSALFKDGLVQTVYMIEYNMFSYNGQKKDDTLIQEFVDLRDQAVPHHIVEEKIDSILSFYEEILIFRRNSLLEEGLMMSFLKRIDRTLMNKNVQSYLDNLNLYFKLDTPYPNLYIRLAEQRSP